jgi:hypothetical protein
VTRWAFGLLALYLVLGLSPVGARKAALIAVVTTALVVAAVTVKAQAV